MLGFFLLLAFFCRFQGITALAMILGASVLHELGHLLILRIMGGKVRYFSASAGGVQIHTDSLELSYFREMAAVLAGPMVNILLGFLLGGMFPFSLAFQAAAGANLVLGLFNLIPAAPLDGWRFLQLVLCWWLGPTRGGRLAALCGSVCALFLSVGLLLLMFYSGGNLWLLPTAAAAAISGDRILRKEL
ncbi:MAG: hypothetical protein E7445_00810 [Ruminococcaceae bacterium]|nr:hypothetical protein [Oscillospiraceae bacterium]